MGKVWVYVFVLMVFLSCKGKKEKALIKRWRVADVTFIDADKATVQSDTMQGNLMLRQQAVLRDVLLKNLYEFKDDGTYITGNAAGTATGKWEISSNAITFISDVEKKGVIATKKIPFEHLSDDSLVLLLNNDQTSVKLKLLLLPVE
jgi:hypothetical protein